MSEAPDYEHHGLVAEAWDLLRGDTSGWADRLYFRAIAERQGGPALDVGCGTGRLMLDYLAAGLDVDGVDNSPEMLSILRAKAAEAGVNADGRLFQQTMNGLDLLRRYATIFVPSSTFQLLTDEVAAAEAMARFHRHLAPGGVLVMSIMSKLWPGRRTPPQMQWFDWRMIAEHPRDDGTSIRRWMRTRYDHERQLEHEENRYEVLRDGEVIRAERHVRPANVRWYSAEQIVALFEEAGFADIERTAAFSFEPPAASDTTFCVVGRAP